jgi:hypothetical protein
VARTENGSAVDRFSLRYEILAIEVQLCMILGRGYPSLVRSPAPPASTSEVILGGLLLRMATRATSVIAWGRAGQTQHRGVGVQCAIQ